MKKEFLKQPFYYTKVREVKNPLRAHSTDAGIDFYIPEDFESIKLNHGDSINISSGIKVVVPEGFAMIFFNKSGIASKYNLDVMACVIDSEYRGIVHINIINNGNETVELKPGMKIIQGVLIPINTVKPIEITNEEYEKFANTKRGEGGFGSTGHF